MLNPSINNDEKDVLNSRDFDEQDELTEPLLTEKDEEEDQKEEVDKISQEPKDPEE